MAALETGWGRSVQNNAYFGIKGISPTGDSGSFVTHEIINGERVRRTAEFRAYESFEEAALDFGRFLTTNPRYAPAFKNRVDPYGFVDAVAAAGYATDPQYASKLKAILRRYVIPSLTSE